ncbi:hypothetical protein N802_17155 [Knoellia sinensis KCTC 19936]|uniref:Uncharacterized protein n=1 Tax=Knoellia sinensis KCTC 19936 TaxID=1385520 RepID=A0A0A0J9H3_9MICO|nr:hypothetical protein [Knoellia sinensis]KGN32687.1 hypothetical protein N802_17155 [Knoellia sinensis KCTC 19936]
MTTSTRPAPTSTRPAPWEPVLWLVVAICVWGTVGWLPAIVVLVLLVAERVIRPGSHVLSTAAVVLLAAIPVAWFLGSSLPLYPPAPRLNDNTLAHQLGGLAIWTLFLAACVEVNPEESDKV